MVYLIPIGELIPIPACSGPWTLVKSLYFVSRYLPLVLQMWVFQFPCEQSLNH